ncbi:MAG: RHS repeat-associated core domain-containing protein, partial [Solirubrobacterales bacterium]
IQKFSSEGALLSSTFLTTGSENGQVKNPQGIAADAAGNLWIADTGNDRMEELKPNLEYIRKFGSEGTGSGQFKNPVDVTTDPEGKLWVLDASSDRAQRFTSEGTYLSQFGAPGPNNGQFSEPKALAADSKGNIWVADTGNDRVQELSGSEFIRQLGGESSGPGHLSAPAGIATDAEGNAWVADTGHDRVQEFNAAGEFVRQFGASGTGNGQFSSPKIVAIDAKGNLWVADATRLQEFKPGGEFVRALSVSSPQDITIDPSGNLWTLEGSTTARIQKFSSEGALLSSTFLTTGSENGQVKNPQGIATDAAGNLWIADTGNNRIEELKPNLEYIRKFGSEGSGSGQFKSPADLTFDPEGKLWVLDSGNTRIQRFTPEGTYLAQFGSSGPNNGQFSEPQEITTDAKGNFWVADTGNDRVQKWLTTVTTTYAYDQAGNLAAIQRPNAGAAPAVNETLAYDATGLLAAKTSGLTTQHLSWDASAQLPLLLNDGERSYLYGPNGLPIEQISAAEEPTYLHHDQLGSTRLLTSASGSTTATFSYSAYGGVEGKTGTAPAPLGYAGQYTDSATGLQYLRARFYDPATGQFLSRDPLEALTRQPYGYARDNPTVNGDPRGLYPDSYAGSEELPCGWCMRFPSAEELKEAAEGAAEEIEEGAENIWNWITGNDESSGETAGPYDNPEEAKEECPLEGSYAGRNKEIGDARQELDKILQWGQQYLIGQGSNPSNPNPNTPHKWTLIIALVTQLLKHRL